MKKMVNGEFIEMTAEEVAVDERLQREYAESEFGIAIRIDELKRQLTDTDYVACKIAEGSAMIADYAEIIAKREEWRSEIRRLEAKLADGGIK